MVSHRLPAGVLPSASSAILIGSPAIHVVSPSLWTGLWTAVPPCPPPCPQVPDDGILIVHARRRRRRSPHPPAPRPIVGGGRVETRHRFLPPASASVASFLFPASLLLPVLFPCIPEPHTFCFSASKKWIALCLALSVSSALCLLFLPARLPVMKGNWAVPLWGAVRAFCRRVSAAVLRSRCLSDSLWPSSAPAVRSAAFVPAVLRPGCPLRGCRSGPIFSRLLPLLRPRRPREKGGPAWGRPALRVLSTVVNPVIDVPVLDHAVRLLPGDDDVIQKNDPDALKKPLQLLGGSQILR